MASSITTDEMRQSPSLHELFRQLGEIDGKAEIIDEGIVVMSPTGALPSLVALRIATALLRYEQAGAAGIAVGDNAIFRVDLPHRKSFSPDAAWYVGKFSDLEPFAGAPMFAVEVRSFGDYGPRAEVRLADKRTDYFAAGTQVVWDVDLRSSELIRCYTKDRLQTPAVFRVDDIAHAEPAVPGWTVAVKDLLPDDWTPPAL